MPQTDWKELGRHWHAFQLFSRTMLSHKNQTTLTTGEIGILSLLYLNQSSTPLQLSKLTGMKSESISRIIKPLLNGGYLTKQKSTEDERSYLLSLTQEGWDLLSSDYKHLLLPLYNLQDKMGDDFDELVRLIGCANTYLKEFNSNIKEGFNE